MAYGVMIMPVEAIPSLYFLIFNYEYHQEHGDYASIFIKIDVNVYSEDRGNIFSKLLVVIEKTIQCHNLEGRILKSHCYFTSLVLKKYLF